MFLTRQLTQQQRADLLSAARAVDLGAGAAPDRLQEQLDTLQRALDLAGQCAARGLRSEVADLLRSLGVVAPVEVDPRYELTAAERRIVAMAAEGLAPSEIAQALFVTSHTVQATVASVSQRLGVSAPGGPGTTS